MSFLLKSWRATLHRNLPCRLYSTSKSCQDHTSTPKGETSNIGVAGHIYETDDFCDHRGMQLVFLGTSSSIPTLKRNNSCLALRLDGTIYLFDCGEGVQKQLNFTPFRPIAIDKIFITHMHGDHIFGLPGLLSGLGLTTSKVQPLNIYGPEGLREWVRTTLKSCYGRVHVKYAVHELIQNKKLKKEVKRLRISDETHEDEIVGEDIRPSQDGLWHLINDEKYVVKAGLLQHSVPCWGFIVQEQNRPGRFNVDRAVLAGVQPGQDYALLQQGHTVTSKNGKKVFPCDVLGHPRRGRKIVILGDTYNSDSLLFASQGADVVVHECTIPEEEAAKAVARSHSTATMAGRFARSVEARCLILTHFSCKYEGRSDLVRTSVKAARRAFGNGKVLAATDLLAVTICQTDEPAKSN